MTHDKQIRNLLIAFLIGLAALIGFFIWDIQLHLNKPHKQQVLFNVSWKDYKLLKQPGLNNFIIRINEQDLSILAADSFADRCSIDIDQLELQAMSTDSLHPDPALLWKDTVNNISHVSYNFSKH